jgi:hypothetical protein
MLPFCRDERQLLFHGGDQLMLERIVTAIARTIVDDYWW